MLGLISLYLSLSTMPTVPRSSVSLALALVAVVMVFRIRNAQKSATIKVRIVSALLVGLFGTITGVMSLSAGLLLHTEIARYEECTSGAITHASMTVCQNQFRDDLNARISRLRSSTR